MEQKEIETIILLSGFKAMTEEVRKFPHHNVHSFVSGYISGVIMGYLALDKGPPPDLSIDFLDPDQVSELNRRRDNMFESFKKLREHLAKEPNAKTTNTDRS